eukprot:TRINITY_DN687_c0_g1_i5.p2 TRINITY_DN687_c0_g1~~TRINITY_DN687_c0_g1_i5.p2  ORF type:complete len:117 (-),score=8.07 TRINITY_DN687_c0_g1_i5:64-414(-)
MLQFSICLCVFCFFFFFKQKTAYEIMPSLVGSEMCIRDRVSTQSTWEQERTVDAQALGGDEGRDKLRQAWGRCKQPLIPGFPNGATRHSEAMSFRNAESKRGELKHLITHRRRKQK